MESRVWFVAAVWLAVLSLSVSSMSLPQVKENELQVGTFLCDTEFICAFLVYSLVVHSFCGFKTSEFGTVPNSRLLLGCVYIVCFLVACSLVLCLLVTL